MIIFTKLDKKDYIIHLVTIDSEAKWQISVRLALWPHVGVFQAKTT
jgi:hypothetical protein